jgi:hypothetical protein
MDADYYVPFDSDMTMPDNDVKLFAKWESTAHKIKFYDGLNEDTYIGTPSDVGKGRGEYLLPVETPYTEGSVVIGNGVFSGWHVFLGDTGNTVKFSYETPIVGDMDLHAIWKTDGFRVAYNIAQGTGATPTDSNEYHLGKETRVAGGEKFVPPGGMVFIGWIEENTDKFYYPGMIMTLYGDALFTAQYGNENEYTQIVYHANYQNANPATVTWHVRKNSSVTLDAGTFFSRTGYSLEGWSRSSGTGNTVNHALGQAIQVVESPVNLYAVWKNNNMYTVRFVDWNGTELKRQQVIYGGNATPPGSPSRSGYRFTGWDRGYTNVTSNITVRALYEIITEKEKEKEKDEPVIPPPPPPGGGDGDINTPPPRPPVAKGAQKTGGDDPPVVTVRTEPTPTTTVKEPMVMDEPVPVQENDFIITGQSNVEDSRIPLFGFPGSLSWALANLIICIAGAILAGVTALRFMRKRRDVQDEQIFRDTEKEEDGRRRRPVWLILTIVFAVAGVILFILTQDMRNPMVVFDIWTIVNVAIFVAELIAIRLAFGKKDEEKENERIANSTI